MKQKTIIFDLISGFLVTQNQLFGGKLKEKGTDVIHHANLVTVKSMLATDVGDEMCLYQLKDVGDGFVHFCHQHLPII